MGRPRLNPDRVLTPAERAMRYRRQHGERVNRTLRKRRQAAAQTAFERNRIEAKTADPTHDAQPLDAPPPQPAALPAAEPVVAPPVPHPPGWLPEWLQHRCCVCGSPHPIHVFGPPLTRVHRWACSDHVDEVNRALIAARDPR
jgi:hypothetical protein